MTRPDRDYDDILSRVLHSTLEPIEPAGDGLAKIQRRIAEPWLKRQWSLLRMELSALGWLVAVRSEPLLTRGRSRLAALRTGSRRRPAAARGAFGAAATRASFGRRYDWAHRGRAGDTGLRRWLGPTIAWLRPTLAVAGAVVIVVAGVFALGRFQTPFAPTGNSSRPNAGAAPGTSGQRASHGQGSRLTPPGQPQGKSPNGKKGGRTRNKPNASPSATCSPTPSPSTSVSPTTSPSPTPTPTPSPTPTQTTSPSPTPTQTSGPQFGPDGGAADTAIVTGSSKAAASCNGPVNGQNRHAA
jgi:hypothetical protein